jgi:FMN reductase
MRILAIGGSIREGSASERALLIAASAAHKAGATVEVISGRALILPPYDPDAGHRTEGARTLVAAIRLADGIIVASPGYHGAISGMVKTALDYAEDLRSDQRVYIDGLAVGCIAVAAGWQAAVSTLNQLRGVVHALRGWPTPFGVALNSLQPLFDESGACLAPELEEQLTTVAAQVLGFAQLQRGAGPARQPGAAARDQSPSAARLAGRMDHVNARL